MSELTPGPQPTAGTDPVDALDFDLWGCRGSRSLIPARSRIANFTSCYSLLHGDALLVMDAGRGLVRLGHQAMTEPRFARVRRVMMLVSHAHVDHWEGLKDADWFWQRGNDTALTVCGPEEALQSIRDGYAPPAYVSLETLATGTARSMEYAAIAAGADRRFAGFHIRAYGLHHYSGAGESKRMLQALGFRITAEGGATVCYLSDHEPTADTRALEQEITSGAHLVVHDANYPNITDHRFGHGLHRVRGRGGARAAGGARAGGPPRLHAPRRAHRGGVARARRRPDQLRPRHRGCELPLGPRRASLHPPVAGPVSRPAPRRREVLLVRTRTRTRTRTSYD